MNEAAVMKKLDELFEMTGCRGGDSHGLYVPAAAQQDLEEALDQLRIQLRYLMFDVEATRRENSYLRRMLELRNRHRRDEDNDSPGG
jgi:hypothetical protein